MTNFKFTHNNFDLIRIIAALQVAVVHSAQHLGLERGPILTLIGALPGVPVFFFVSGFLVSASLERSSSLRSYAVKRILRIYPALWACLAVGIATALLWGNVSFKWSEFWPWFVTQITFVQFYNPEFLRDYGVGVLNGSLWTIPVELQFYIALPLIYAIMPRRPTAWLLAAAFVFMICNQALVVWDQHSNGLLVKLYGVTAAPWLYMFLLGVVLQKNQQFVERFLAGRFFAWFAVFAAATMLLNEFALPVRGNSLNPISAMLLGLLTISAAYTRPRPGILHGYDLSYGLYIYHMLIVNGMVHIGAAATYGSMWIAVGFSLGAAYLSWVLIERPALGLKTRVHKSAFVRSKSPTTETIAAPAEPSP